MSGDSRLLKRTILQVVDNQLRDNTPPEARQAYQRLVAHGYSPGEAKRLIANLVAREIYDVLKDGRAYDQARYVAALSRLPDLPD
jgi:uncharacterized protein YoaH (UPF0181 family)